jgi:hypothetical protein
MEIKKGFYLFRDNAQICEAMQVTQKIFGEPGLKTLREFLDNTDIEFKIHRITMPVNYHHKPSDYLKYNKTSSSGIISSTVISVGDYVCKGMSSFQPFEVCIKSYFENNWTKKLYHYKP